MSVNDDNSDLVRPLASLLIKETVNEEADHEPFPGERLLNGEVYSLVTTISKKWHRTFWGFQQGGEIIHKHDGISCWPYSFCEAADVTKIFSATSIFWIGNHLRKRHQQQKPSSSPNKTISSSSIFIRGFAFSPVTPEQLALLKLNLITWMVKKHISYSLVKDEDFCKFVASCSLGAISAETLLSRSEVTIRSWILDEYCSRKVHLCEKILGIVSSVIHIFFDLWTTPNNSVYIDVIAHFLDAKKQLRTVVLAVCNIHGDHSGKNQAKAYNPGVRSLRMPELPVKSDGI